MAIPVHTGKRWVCPWCGALLLLSVERCPCGYVRDGSEEIVDLEQDRYAHGMLRKLLGREAGVDLRRGAADTE